MKRRRRLKMLSILLSIGLLVWLGLGWGQWIPRALRKPDAVVAMKTTGYCACGKCCGWEWSQRGLPVYSSGRLKGHLKRIGQTASGKMARPGRVAVDPKRFPMGTIFYIPGYGWAVASDTGGAIRGQHLDLFFWRHSTALRWGVRTPSIKVWYPRD